MNVRVSSKRRESTSHWGEERSCSEESALELDREVFHGGRVGLRRVDSGPELPGFQLAPAMICHVVLDTLLRFSVLSFLINKFGTIQVSLT